MHLDFENFCLRYFMLADMPDTRGIRNPLPEGMCTRARRGDNLEVQQQQAGAPPQQLAATGPPTQQSAVSVLTPDIVALVTQLNQALVGHNITIPNTGQSNGTGQPGNVFVPDHAVPGCSQDQSNDGGDHGSLTQTESDDPDYVPSGSEGSNEDVATSGNSDSDSTGKSFRVAPARKHKRHRRAKETSTDSDDTARPAKRHKGKKRKAKRKRHSHAKSSSSDSSSSSSSTSSSSESEGDAPKSHFNTNRVRLDLRIPDKLKQKIWDDKYIELGELLSAARKPGALFENKKHKKGKKQTLQISQILDWVSAFNVFVAVYTMKFPENSPSLMHYIHTIMELAHNGGDWVNYDHEFRVARVAEPRPWHELNTELYMTYRYARAPGRQAPANKGRGDNQTRRNFPSGTCWKFHAGKECNRSTCQFPHSCYICNGMHPAFQCARRAQGNANRGRGNYQRQGNNQFAQGNNQFAQGNNQTAQGNNQPNPFANSNNNPRRGAHSYNRSNPNANTREPSNP